MESVSKHCIWKNFGHELADGKQESDHDNLPLGDVRLRLAACHLERFRRCGYKRPNRSQKANIVNGHFQEMMRVGRRLSRAFDFETFQGLKTV